MVHNNLKIRKQLLLNNRIITKRLRLKVFPQCNRWKLLKLMIQTISIFKRIIKISMGFNLLQIKKIIKIKRNNHLIRKSAFNQSNPLVVPQRKITIFKVQKERVERLPFSRKKYQHLAKMHKIKSRKIMRWIFFNKKTLSWIKKDTKRSWINLKQMRMVIMFFSRINIFLSKNWKYNVTLLMWCWNVTIVMMRRLWY